MDTYDELRTLRAEAKRYHPIVRRGRKEFGEHWPKHPHFWVDQALTDTLERIKEIERAAA